MPRKDEKKRRRRDDDDDSVDSKGNIRNLIDYDYDESSEEELFEFCNQRWVVF